MNILILNWRDINHPRAGGAEVRLHEVYSPLTKQGHKVILFSSLFKNAKKNDFIDGINISRLGNDFTFSFLCMINLSKWVKNYSIDVVVEDLNKLPFYSPLVYKGPLIIQMHHLWKKSIFHEASFFVALSIWLSEKSISWVYKNCNFSVVSSSTKKELIKLGISNKKIKVIYNGIDLDLYKPRKIEKKLVLLWVGRIQRYKGPIEACKILKLLLNDFPNLKLVIVGDGPYRKKVEDFVNQNQLPVKFTGFLNKEEKISWFQTASIHLQSSYKEGWGLSIIEANACGCPVVANDTTGLCDSVQNGKTGLLYEYNNIKDGALKIKLLLENKDLCKRLISSGLEWSKEFSWEKNSKEIFALLEKKIND